jgi:alpha-L-rhamnosidase
MLNAQQIAPIRVKEAIAPVEVRRLDDGRFVADFGGTLMGWTSLELAGREFQRVTLRHGEALNPDGSLDRKHAASHTYGRYQEQRCIASGRGYRYEPRFTYHGFRYVEAEGLDEPPAEGRWHAQHAYADLPVSGSFECSNPELVTLHDAARRTLLDCAFYSPTAEAVREKIAWHGDNVFCMRSFFAMFDAAALYRKAVRDALDAQEPSGHALPVTPSGGWGRAGASGERVRCDDPCWSMSFVEIAAELYSWYGDREIVAEVCDPALRYLDYLGGTANDGLIDWSLGDWKDRDWSWAEGPGLTSVPVTGTLSWFRLAGLCARLCETLGRTEDAARCRRRADAIRSRFNERFVAPDGRVATGSQTAQALALFYGALPPPVRAAAVGRLVRAMREADGHLTSGFMGTMPVLNVLCDGGRTDVAYEAVTKPSGSGWMWQLEGTRPTLAESIHPHDMRGNSTHHHQFSACVAGWLYGYLGGIRPDGGHPGFAQFRIRPVFPKDIEWVRASIECPRGRIESHWERTGADGIRIELRVPGNCAARLELPAGRGPAAAGEVYGPGRHVVERAREDDIA